MEKFVRISRFFCQIREIFCEFICHPPKLNFSPRNVFVSSRDIREILGYLCPRKFMPLAFLEIIDTYNSLRVISPIHFQQVLNGFSIYSQTRIMPILVLWAPNALIWFLYFPITQSQCSSKGWSYK